MQQAADNQLSIRIRGAGQTITSWWWCALGMSLRVCRGGSVPSRGSGDDQQEKSRSAASPRSCTTGWQGHLAADAARIDVELAERGWLVVPQDAGEPMLTPAEVAQEFEVTSKTARLWMADGRVPSIHWADRMVTRDSVASAAARASRTKHQEFRQIHTSPQRELIARSEPAGTVPSTATMLPTPVPEES